MSDEPRSPTPEVATPTMLRRPPTFVTSAEEQAKQAAIEKAEQNAAQA